MRTLTHLLFLSLAAAICVWPGAAPVAVAIAGTPTSSMVAMTVDAISRRGMMPL